MRKHGVPARAIAEALHPQRRIPMSRLLSIVTMLVCALARRRSRPVRPEGLSQPADPAGRSLCRRRRHGFHRPLSRPRPRAQARRASDHREPAGLRHCHRRRLCGQGGTRRLHAAARHQRHRRLQSDSQQEPALRSNCRFRADLDGGGAAFRSGRQSQHRQHSPPSVDLAKAKPGRSELCIRRQRIAAPYLHGTAEEHGRHRHQARALSRRRPGAYRCDRGTCPGHDR